MLQAGPLLKLQCPCIFITGERDPLCPAEKLTATQQEMSGTCQTIQIAVRAIPRLCPAFQACIIMAWHLRRAHHMRAAGMHSERLASTMETQG